MALTNGQEKQALATTIEKIADAARGAVDGWDFKMYIFGTLFYRYLSEYIATRINKNEWDAGNADFDYAKLNDEDIKDDIREDIIREFGFFLYPSELFCNVVKNAQTDVENLNVNLDKALKNIEKSSIGHESEKCFSGIFDDFDVNSSKLGATVLKRNARMRDILIAMSELNLGDFDDTTSDVLGDAFEMVAGYYAKNAGRSGGEYFTPAEVSMLVAKLSLDGRTHINKVYDPTCGSGSLLLKAAKIIGDKNIDCGYFGQDNNLTSSRLCKLNMFLHHIPYNKFKVYCDDTLTAPQHWDDQPFDMIVSNPPYSVKWIGNDDPTLINDQRFAPAGVLAPKSKADFAFILHTLAWLSNQGTATIVCFPGIFYRSGAEQKIRKYLIDNNFIDAIIQLPENLFYGTSISTCLLRLKKNKKDNKVLFVDASKEFEKDTNNNRLSDENIDNIFNIVEKREDVEYVAKLVDYDDIVNNKYNLSTSTYIEKPSNKKAIDINALNKEIAEIVAKENKLRAEIDEIIKEIE